MVCGGASFASMELSGTVDSELHLFTADDLVSGWFVAEGDDKIGKELI